MRGWWTAVVNEGDSIRIHGKSKVSKKKFFQAASWCRTTPPSYYPIPLFQTQEEGCRRNKQTGLWSPRWWLPIRLFLVFSLSVSASLALSLYSHVCYRHAHNHSLANQWHTQNLSFLFTPSSLLSPFTLPCASSSHHLPSLRLLHVVIVSGVNRQCHTLHLRLVSVQPKKWCIPSTPSEAAVEREGWLAGRWNCG